MNNKKIMILAVILGILTALSLFFYINKVEQTYKNVPMAKVIVAKAAIPAKSELAADKFVLKSMPRDFVNEGMATSLEQIKGAISKVEIGAGEVVLLNKIVKKSDAGSGLAYAVPEGKRAMSIPITEVTGVADLINPGDRVDVLATVEVPNSEITVDQQEKTKTITSVILQDVTVLSVSQKTDITTVEEEAQKEKEKSTKSSTKTLTLAVTVAEAQDLTLANERGSLRVLLRSPIDVGKVQNKYVDLKQLEAKGR